ncbi:SCO1860 family LAETG-anchored protein [Streptomyces sp. NPDC048604]|uniref:SCO1860 family LAETG-anchored protein n=1 Tax=Streptomyces sp. NPDC048604 TaxID=3365578 RepID=UPI00371ED8EC
MNSNAFRMPARRTAAAATVVALAVGPVALAAPAAQATGGKGRASAVVLRTGLDVSLLDKTLQVPLKASLNEVHAPASADRTALTVELDGVDRGKPFSVLRADVATARATVDDKKAEGYTNLAKARLHVPGLPLLSLIEVEKVTSKAVCETGKQPVAESNVLGHVTVLGRKTKLTGGGTTKVTVPGVGEVTLDLSKTHTTSRTAAATALQLKVAVNPLKLNVAEVNGEVTLAEATCETPRAAEPPKSAEPTPSAEQGEPSAEPSKKPADTGISTQSGGDDLAETGGSSVTPYLAGGGLVLLLAGGAAIAVTRSRRSGTGA